MNVLLFMIPVALLLGGGFVVAFFWAVSKGQLDDLDTPQHRILNNHENETQKQRKEAT